ncbi:hypothetical protein DNTS_024180 [Danionella cerebrum]|uniref:UDP-N-acetylglucosamine transferase subunit ALG13 n=1 Tax=Danionella cerebrum TaxID=2873325 RepID=A0A553RIL0_9TELE|nr:hypothetical protein DNTS_024180 [Danionella translucida]
MKTVFVTVGTTSFDDLIDGVTSGESVKALIQRGFTDMVLQVGRGSAFPDPGSCPGLFLKVFRFKDSIAEDMRTSDLVISHAALLVVVNDKLMDNHQLELAQQLQAESHLLYCTCSTLPQTLRDMDLAALVPFAPSEPQRFAHFLDKAAQESMSSLHESGRFLGLLCLIVCFQRSSSESSLGMRCKIINLEYVECTWHSNTTTDNQTFSSRFVPESSQEECQDYILERNLTQGCRIPLKGHESKFKTFETTLKTEGNHTTHSFHSLVRSVQLNPPFNLSLTWSEQSGTLLLVWISTAPLSKNCVVYMVRNQNEPAQSKRYVFQVRSTVADSCGSSDLWSDWSDSVTWSGTGSVFSKRAMQVVFALLSIIPLLLLGMLLCCCERKNIVMFPIVPDPSRSLQDLFHKHNGNVESWVHISRELKEAFEPDYTEPSCDVCEGLSSCDTGPKPEASAEAQTEEELVKKNPCHEVKPNNQKFLVNANCPGIVLTQYLKSRLRVAKSEFIDLCDERGELKMLFLCQNVQESARALLRARESFIACITMQRQIETLEIARQKQLHALPSQVATSEELSGTSPSKTSKKKKKVHL